MHVGSGGVGGGGLRFYADSVSACVFWVGGGGGEGLGLPAKVDNMRSGFK